MSGQISFVNGVLVNFGSHMHTPNLIRFVPVLLLAFFFSSCIESTKKPVIIDAPSAIGSRENPYLRHEFEMNQVVDPATGQLPRYIRHKEHEFSKKRKSLHLKSSARKAETWNAVGPFNVGGRTRALALDVRDEEIIVAGGASGRMYRSENGGSTWTSTSDPTVINGATCLAQDVTPGNEDVWYYGTGELRGNSAGISQIVRYRGDGIFKSQDGGRTWDVLPSTSFGQYSDFDSPFNYVWNIKVKPAESGPGEIYAAIYGGIVRSVDGGNTWETVLGTDLMSYEFDDLNYSGAAYYTNVILTPGGRLYAVLNPTFIQASSDNPYELKLPPDSTVLLTSDTLISEGRGIYYSDNGLDWIDIAPGSMRDRYARVVMDYAPSDESIVYFLLSQNDLEDIWRYEDGLWQMRNGGIPDGTGDLPAMDTQNSYNMVIKVHPSNPEIVYIGGTNLFRSTDGFSTLSNTTHIGGYKDKSSTSVYEGHHPDQHEIVFYPSNPNKMLTGNDGGIRRTLNNREGEVSWRSLNNGYVTSQFYTVSVAKDPTSDKIIGGMQDNGTYLMPEMNQNAWWNRVIGGDGSYTASTRDDIFWYVSFQQGSTFRIEFNDDDELEFFAQVDPSDGSGYLFINPFVLDPFNHHRMYMAGGDVVWRNDNLTQIPGGRQEPTPVGWKKIRESSLNNMNISTLDASSDVQGTLYYGSAQGHVFKLTNAHNNRANRQQIMFQDGFVTCVAIDPSDADHAVFTYGNYGINSIFTVTAENPVPESIGGNLEENPDGTGNGPSVRWCEIVPMADGSNRYFVGTSIGMFTTTELDGENTVWVQEGEETIGSSVIRMMDYNYESGRLAVATHGNGVFETTLENTLVINPPVEAGETLAVEDGFPNPFSSNLNIRFNIPRDGRVKVFILNASGQEVKKLLDATQYAGDVWVEWDGTNQTGMQLQEGMYLYTIEYEGAVVAKKALLWR